MLDLLFGEVGPAAGARLIEEVGRCESCRGEWETFAATLSMVDGAAEVATPGDSFWVGYEARLRVRLDDAATWPQVLDGAGQARPAGRAAYRLTLIEEVGLHRRLARHLRDVALDSQLTWPAFKADPFGFTRRFVAAYASFAWRFLSQRDVALATVSSFVVVCTVVGGLVGLERLRLSSADKSREKEKYELIGMMPANAPGPERREGESGSPGRASGSGGGSLTERARPHGGGGGGNGETSKASNGKLPPAAWEPQTVAPSPHPQTVKNPQLPLAPNLQGDPALFPPDYRNVPHGDPRSDSQVASAGEGTGGGIGESDGGGTGEGHGGGFGAGRGGNTGGGAVAPGGGGAGGAGGPSWAHGRDGVFRAGEVERKAVITSKPEPGFSEEARKANVTGVVKLRLVLKADGTVGEVYVVKPLPYGLTERTITAAKRIQFTPARIGGRPVSQWMTIEYNFNIY